ncbi:hypothetical protein KAR91_46690 [Candidatus Pacearchaeota archaeon]|nr:hypothetical protein [Candidatus Pacearchaeota archaeon]
MNSAVDRALKIVNDNYSIICQGHQEVMAIVITQALKEQDKITRHACAESLDILSTYHPGALCKTYVAIDEAKEAIINTKSV